jgi:hypothetical protein
VPASLSKDDVTRHEVTGDLDPLPLLVESACALLGRGENLYASLLRPGSA